MIDRHLLTTRLVEHELDAPLQPDEQRLYVAPDALDFFRGWLEFAGPDPIAGVDYWCPRWPREFTIRERGPIVVKGQLVTEFVIRSPAFLRLAHGLWLPYWIPRPSLWLSK